MRIAIAAAVVLCGCGSEVTQPEVLREGTPIVSESSPPPGFLLGGIQVNEADHAVWFRELQRGGFNTVSVTSYAKQGDWDSSNLWWEAEEPWVVEEIRGAKAAGLEVVLIPRVALDHAFERNRFLWHGMIYPARDEDVLEWFRRYREFVLGWARIASELGVDVLGIGSEMRALTATAPEAELSSLAAWYLSEEQQAKRRAKHLEFAAEIPPERLRDRGQEQPHPDLGAYLDDRVAAERAWAVSTTFGGDTPASATQRAERRALLDREWRRLIAEVRKVYSGTITYAANFDEYREVGFWDDLDLIGINAYFPLRELPDPEISEELLATELELGWQRVYGEIETFLAKKDLGTRQVLFTELGYTRFRDMSVAPWAGDGFTLLEHETGDRLIVWPEQPLRPNERALAIAALQRVEAARPNPLLAGVLWWKLTTIASHVEIEPFVLLLGAGDPLEEELRRLGSTDGEGPGTGDRVPGTGE